MMKKSLVAILLGVAVLVGISSPIQAANKQQISDAVDKALAEFYQKSKLGKELSQKAVGILVFPKVVKVGLGLGGEYGEGALIVDGEKVAFYNTASASIGFQLGAQVKHEVIMFMNKKALKSFRNNSRWEVGVDGSIAVVTVGTGGEVDTNTLNSPMIGFIFSNKGLMYNLTFEGAKISEIYPQ